MLSFKNCCLCALNNPGLLISRHLRSWKTRTLPVTDVLSANFDEKDAEVMQQKQLVKKAAVHIEKENFKNQKKVQEKQNLMRELDAIMRPPVVADPSEKVTYENQHRKLAEVLSPLWNVPYDKQLTMKYKKNKHILKTFGERARHLGSFISRKSGGLPCTLEKVRPSPIQEQYRNKDEFNVNIGVDGNPKTVGFYVGAWEDNSIVTVPCDQIIISKDSHKLVARSFQDYIRASEYPTCLSFSQGGVWRQIRVRSNDEGDLMGIIVIFPQDLTEDSILNEQEKLKEYFLNGQGKQCNLKSLYFQTSVNTRSTHDQSPYKLLFGEPHLYENVNGLKVRISPESFFQCNKSAAEILYKTIVDMPIKDPSISFLDLCCGTGLISLMMAQQVKEVIGIDVMKQSITDAKQNAVDNGIKNVKFYCGEVEALTHDALKSSGNKDIVAVVNPTRGGLTYKVIDALRQSKSVHQLIYVSCQPEGRCMQDFERLCLPTSKRRGMPFILRNAVPVDLFPHTNHCELVMLFDHLL